MDGATERLHHRRGHDVARHRGERIDAEEEDEHRRHQRAATHPRQADDEADHEAAQHQTDIHREGSFVVGPASAPDQPSLPQQRHHAVHAAW